MNQPTMTLDEAYLRLEEAVKQEFTAEGSDALRIKQTICYLRGWIEGYIDCQGGRTVYLK